ncbi:hypothetical protein EMIT0215P_290007 [Pseudomonas serboccidentalis]
MSDTSVLNVPTSSRAGSLLQGLFISLLINGQTNPPNTDLPQSLCNI